MRRNIFIFVICCLFLFSLVSQATAGTYIELKKIVLNQSEILTTAEIEEITRDYEGREVSIEELHEAVARINKLYREKGYIAAQAILPPQKVKEGVVRIKLVEGRVGAVTIKDNQSTTEKYFLDRVTLKGGELVDANRLEKELRYFNQTNDVQLKAELKAGQEYATTDIILKAIEPSRFQVAVTLDNSGREETGEHKLGIALLDRSVRGCRDILSINLQGSEGSGNGSLAYEFPVYKKGDRIGISYSQSGTTGISGTLKSLDFRSESADINLKYQRPFLVKPGLKIKGSLDINEKKTASYFAGIKLQDVIIRTASAGVDAQFPLKRGICSTTLGLTNGFVEWPEGGQGDQANNFLKYDGSFSWQTRLNQKQILSLQTMLQYAPENKLPSSEQSSLGGMATIRGYQEGLLSSGQSYYLLRAELTDPTTKPEEKFKGFLFLDTGRIYPAEPAGEGSELSLTSIGLGTIINFNENYSGKFVLGLPLNRGYDPHIHFMLQSSWQFDRLNKQEDNLDKTTMVEN